MTPTDTPSKVLVIDDELGPRESLRFLLKPYYQVFCADGVDRGLELLREHQPEAVILDIRMPGRSGIDGLQEVRRIDPDTAVIMLTGYAALGTAQEALRHGASDYLEKPFDTAEMRRTVRWHVARTRLRRQRAQLVRDMEQMQARLAAELQQRDHLAELGQASAEFVHDLRNVLAGTCSSVELLRLELSGEESAAARGDPSLAEEYLGMMEHTAMQCKDLLDAWGGLIHRRPSRECLFPLDTLIAETVAACQSAAQARGARLQADLETPGTHVLGDRVQMGRALSNLIHNAIQALPPAAGSVTVCVRHADRQVQIRVIDNGGGIRPEVLGRVFQPQFTTRQAHGGMGLGLFIARKVVEAHGGTLSVEKTAGQGTTMLITLPLQAPASPATGAAG